MSEYYQKTRGESFPQKTDSNGNSICGYQWRPENTHTLLINSYKVPTSMNAGIIFIRVGD